MKILEPLVKLKGTEAETSLCTTLVLEVVKVSSCIVVEVTNRQRPLYTAVEALR